MSKKQDIDFDTTIEACRSVEEVTKICLSTIEEATKIVSPDNIKVIEQELEKDEESHIIVNIEKALMKLLGIGFKIQDVLDHVSKILDQIQPGK